VADLETSVAITAQTDDLRSGMAQAADSVAAATTAISLQFAELGDAARQAQDQISAATAQIGSSLSALQTRAANLVGSVNGAMGDLAGSVASSSQFPGIAVSEQDSTADQQRLLAAAYSQQKSEIGDAASVGDISRSQEIASLKDALDVEWGLEQDFYQKKQAAAADDALTQQKLMDQQEIAYEKYLTQRERLDTEAVQASERQWQSLLQPIQRSLDSSITGLIIGTTTVQKAFSNLGQSVIGEAVSGIVGSGFSSLGKALGSGLLGGGGSEDQDFSGGVGGALGLGNLFGAGGLFGTLFRGVGSLFGFAQGGIVPSAQGGWAVPQLGPGGVLAQLHSNEMVLPANISQGLQSMIAGGGQAAPNVTFAVSAMDSQSVATFFKNNGSLLVQAINRAMRNGSPIAGMAT
jgi:hypothetical protein